MSLGKCVINGKDAAVVVYPLLPGHPSFCHEHHNTKDAGPFGVDFSGPDDFNIPWEEESEFVFKPPYDSKTGIWTAKDGRKEKLTELSDAHLSNLEPWIKRQAAKADRTVGVNIAILAVQREIARRSS